jgi:hypothetical protein
LHLHLGGGGLEIGDVALDRRVQIGEVAVDHEARAEPLAQAGDAVVLGVEFGEGDAVLPATRGGHGILGLFVGQGSRGDAGEAVVHVEGPVAALAELAVADDVDPGLGLLANHLADRLRQARLVVGTLVGLAILDLVQKLDQLGRPHQAADMGCQDAVAGHFPPHCYGSGLSFPYHLRIARGSRAAAGEGANGREFFADSAWQTLCEVLNRREGVPARCVGAPLRASWKSW